MDTEVLSLTDVSLFHEFRETDLSALKLIFEWLRPEMGARLFEQGDLALYLYVVVKGEVAVVYKPDDGPELVVTRVKGLPGETGVIGWSSVVGSPLYTSAAECATDCILMRARASDLRLYCDISPEAGQRLLERLATLIAERMRNTYSQVIALLEQGLGVQISRHVV